MAKRNDTFEEIIDIIKESKSILVLGHKSPDGDAVGSSLAMYLALLQLDKEADVMLINYSEMFKFLPGASKIKETSNKEYDLVITLDSATLNRVEQSDNFFEKAKHTINIDHHPTNEGYAEYNYVDKGCPATCQTLYKFFLEEGIIIDKRIVECLIAGIITDTNGFRNENTNSLTFDIASHLYKLGVNISRTYINALYTRTKPQFALTTIATSRLEFFYDDRVAFTYITLKDEEKVKAKAGDHEGIVEVGRSVEGVDISIFLHEGEEGFKVSLRSTLKYDVSKVADKLGGGGHKQAAGCVINKPVEEAKEILLKEIKKIL